MYVSVALPLEPPLLTSLQHQRAEVESSLKLYAEYINAHTNTMKAKPLDRDEPFHRFRPSHGYSTTSDVTSAVSNEPLVDPFVEPQW